MAIVTIECDEDHPVHEEALRLHRLLVKLGIVPVSIGPGTVRNLKLTFAIEFKTEGEAARFRAALAEAPITDPSRGGAVAEPFPRPLSAR